MEVVATIFIGLLCVLVFGLICLFGWFWYQAYRMRNKAEDFVIKKASEVDVNKVVSKFQQKLEAEMAKKNKK